MQISTLDIKPVHDTCLLNISSRYPDPCNRVFRREVLFTQKAWEPVECGIRDGMLYARIHDRKYHPAVPQFALYHVLVSSKGRQIKRNDQHALFRSLLRYDGLFHLLVFKISKYGQRILISMPDEF